MRPPKNQSNRYPPTLIRAIAVHMMQAKIICYLLSASDESYLSRGIVRFKVRVMKTPYTQLLYSKTGVFFFFFLFLPYNIDRGYSLEPPHLGGSNVYPRSMF